MRLLDNNDRFYGDPAGFVAVSAFDEPATATIIHIGVLPGQRGHGYGRQLLGTATLAAEAAVFWHYRR
jgi:ribosomal protein S18 acetylase RimI-like enzyme